jgi:hypothetical protein
MYAQRYRIFKTNNWLSAGEEKNMEKVFYTSVACRAEKYAAAVLTFFGARGGGRNLDCFSSQADMPFVEASICRESAAVAAFALQIFNNDAWFSTFRRQVFHNCGKANKMFIVANLADKC